MVIHQDDRGEFAVHTVFNIAYLSPIQQYVDWKFTHDEWDDYNEYHRACRMVEVLQQNPDVWFHTHTLFKHSHQIGVLLIVGGKIQTLEKKFTIAQEDQSLLLKYFHITMRGKGLGQFWITSVVCPYYNAKGFQSLYVNSSHRESFPFYERLGSQIATYQQESDHGMFVREGRCFQLKMV